ncbi:MAG: hypothetical protein ABIC91_00980 [Nanoarchaeota archaeon]|nr:hypothetical protein [Nanoarchaeota archaeon]
MLKEIIVGTAILIGGTIYAKTTNQDSTIVSELSKEYAIEDTTQYNALNFPIIKKRIQTYEKLKENYSNPELIDTLIKFFKEPNIPIEIIPNTISSLNLKDGVSDLLMGDFYKQENNLNLAKKYYQKSINKGLEFSETYRYLGDMKLARADKRNKIGFDEMEQLYQKAIEFDSTNKIAYWHLAETYVLKKDYAKALKTVNKTFEISPTEIQDYFHRMLIIENLLNGKNLRQEVKDAIKKCYLKDTNTMKNCPTMIFCAYNTITDSEIFTTEDVNNFEEKYREQLKTSELFQITSPSK